MKTARQWNLVCSERTWKLLQIPCRKWGRETSSRSLLLFKNALLEVKASNLQLSYNLFQYSSTWHKSKLYKTLSYWSRDMLNFDFLEKGLGIASIPYFAYGFSRKMFLLLHSINWPNIIVWWPLFLKILDNMCCNCLFPRLWHNIFWN